MLFRFVAAAMFTAAGALIGIKRADSLRTAREISRSIDELFLQCAALLRAQALSVYELAAQLKRSDGLQNLSFIRELPTDFDVCIDFCTSWRKAVSAQKDIAEDERQLLLRFGDILGTTDIEGQLCMIGQLSEQSHRLTLRRSEEYIQKGRLFRSIWTLLGIMAGILVI